MKRPPPTPEPASRPAARLTVTVPAELDDLLLLRAGSQGVSVSVVVRAAPWRSFGMREPAKKRGAR